MSQALIRKGAIVENVWTDLADDAPPPAAGRVVVSLARWKAEGATLKAGAAEIGVRLPNTADVLALWPEIQDRPLLALEFPKFGDGRAFSLARLLRERLGFKGEIRAVGDGVQRDLLFYMQRVGIDAFLVRADQDPQDCLKALNDFSLAYQHGADSGAATVWELRRAQT